MNSNVWLKLTPFRSKREGVILALIHIPVINVATINARLHTTHKGSRQLKNATRDFFTFRAPGDEWRDHCRLSDRVM